MEYDQFLELLKSLTSTIFKIEYGHQEEKYGEKEICKKNSFQT